MQSILVLGGSGVFGFQIADTLVQRGHAVTLAARDLKKLEMAARPLGEKVKIKAFDARDFFQCREACAGHTVVVHAAGPFSADHTEVLAASSQAGCHYVDIADDRAYLQAAQAYHPAFLKNGRSAVLGCSTLPGVSGALAKSLRERRVQSPETIEVLLFIGNRNQKGKGASDSVFKIMGKSFPTNDGPRIGMRELSPVELPQPFGRKLAADFESPEYDLFPQSFGVKRVAVRVAFEWPLINRVFSHLSRRSEAFRRTVQGPLLRLGKACSGFGSSGGGVRVDFIYADGTSEREEIFLEEGGQRLATLPAVLTVEKILQGKLSAGVVPSYDVLDLNILRKYLP